jgi:hypothetical protein
VIQDVIEQKINHQVQKEERSFFVSNISFLDTENYALEKYSSESKCFDHGSIWEQYIDHCQKKRRVTPQAAGCYQVLI